MHDQQHFVSGTVFLSAVISLYLLLPPARPTRRRRLARLKVAPTRKSHDRPHPAIRQRQLFRHLPGGLGRHGRGQSRPRARLWRGQLDGPRRRPFPPAVRDRLRGVLRLQRHRRQLPGPGQPVPELPQRDLLGDRPRRDRRMRRAGVLLQRLQAAHRAHPRRQADCGDDPRGRAEAPGHPLPQAARGDPDPGHRGRHRLPPRGGRRDQPGVQGAEAQPAHGWRALLQCLRLPRLQPGRADLEPTPAPSSAAPRRS